MLADTINHWTDKHYRTGQTFLQVRLCQGVGLERERERELKMIFRSWGALRPDLYVQSVE